MRKVTPGNSSTDGLKLGIAGFSYGDLYRPQRLRDLHAQFNRHVEAAAPELLEKFEAYRKCQGENMPAPHISDLLVEMAAHVGLFVARLFNIETERQRQIQEIESEKSQVFVFRDKLVKKAGKKYRKISIDPSEHEPIKARIRLLLAFIRQQLSGLDPELELCHLGLWLDRLAADNAHRDEELVGLRNFIGLQEDQASHFESALSSATPGECAEILLDYLLQWIHIASVDKELVAQTSDWICFKSPGKTDFRALVGHELRNNAGYSAWVAPQNELRPRDGFALTDRRFNQRQVQYEVDHCIYCHDRDADSCSKGMRNKKSSDYTVNSLGVTITGCPMEEKISEMHVVKGRGDNIGALALIIIDNPMCPGTGHRICNDCMQGCIYQKTEPVNIPQIETNIFTDVLFMPWGFEIYSLLTRWNPLHIKRPYALPYNGKNVLVAGLGPAGYTLAHYLVNEGFAVTGIDALKIEPLPEELAGTDTRLPKPIRDFRDHYQELDKRMSAGFGGVAEYGITVRWDKNFLTVIYLNLLRRANFRCFGGVRFGGTITIEDAWDLNFDHIAIATGAGKPTIIGLKNNLVRGIRKASDFLMALQLTGAAKGSSLANLQLRLPAGVVGGGLTAIDTATEAMAYYPGQVEKVLSRYEKLGNTYGRDQVRGMYDEEELLLLDEFLEHGKAVQKERRRAEAAKERPDFRPLLEQWGGVTLFYRKGIEDSPAYRQNHEEIREAMREGIQLAEGMSPIEAMEDEYGALSAVKFNTLRKLDEGKWANTDSHVTLPLKSLFIAAGTSPNTIYEQEHPYSFRMDEKFFRRYEPKWSGSDGPELVPMDDATHPKLGKPAPMTSYHKNGKFISFYGDSHPVYAGNVANAMASARDGYPYITRLFEPEIRKLDPADQAQRDGALKEFFASLHRQLTATVVEVNRLAPTIIEVIVEAPLQANKFSPGQFYRVQNLESAAPVYENTVLAAEGLALTGAWVDKEKGLISLITLEMGSSSRLCGLWQPGDRIVVMGVTGEATHISRNRTVMLVGGGLGNAVQFSIGKALQAAGNRVIYFAGYRKSADVFKVSEIEAASDVIVWAVDRGENVAPIPVTRRQDKSYVGNILEAIEAYARGELGDGGINLKEVDHMIVIGSDRMMAAVKEARHGRLKPYLKENHTAIGSINSPMQCMMKGVCAQCLCRHISPDTGEEYFVYSCYNQDQELDRVDFDHLKARLRQNSVQEKLSNLWLDYLLASQAN